MNARPKKKPTITVTPEIHARAVQYLADRMLDLADRIGKSGADYARAREITGMPPNEAHIVQEVAAQMALAFAKRTALGETTIVLNFDQEPPRD